MDATQAIKLLIQRNQELVNKNGETTRYTRETDDIINALLPVLKRDIEHRDMRRKVELCGRIIGVSNILDCADAVPVEFLERIERADYKRYTDQMGSIQPFFVEDLSVYLGQIKEAYLGYLVRQQDIKSLIDENNKIIQESDDLEFINFLRSSNHDLLSELRDLV